MSDSWRLKLNLQDKTAAVGAASAFGTGATVIPAARGSSKPTKINVGETERIRQLYGAKRFESLEAIAYNTSYPLWISAPHKGGTVSGVLLTSEGLKNISFVGEKDTVQLNNLPMQKFAGTGNAVVSNFSTAFDGSLVPTFGTGAAPDYTPAASLVVDGEVTPMVLTWAADTFSFTTSIDGVGSGTITVDPTAGVLMSWSFTTAPTQGSQVSLRLGTDVTILTAEVYALIGMNFPCTDFLSAAVYKSDDTDVLTLDLRQLRNGSYVSLTNYPADFSLVEGFLNGSGLLIYGPQYFDTDDNIFMVVDPDTPMDWETWTGGSETSIVFKDGFRGVEVTGVDLVAGWDQFKDIKKYSAEVYFDVTADSAVPVAMVAIREGFAKYKTFLYPQPITTAADCLAATPLTVANRGLKTFWGAAYIRNVYESTGNLISTLMGEVASKYADAIVNSYGGRAVAWADENGVGGQLSQGRIVEFLYTADEAQSKAMDTARINPIGPNDLFGPIVMSRRSTDKSSGDYSFADYSMIVDYCVERIFNEVLPYQLVKFNDDAHRATVRNKADAILKPLLAEPNNVLADYAIKCDAENNSDEVRAREEFVLTVAIKVTRKAEYVIFNFINTATDGSVVEDVS